jgi:spore germination protein KB
MVYPALMLVQMMAIGDFFDRIDPILVAVWAFAMFIKGAVLLLILSELLSRLLRVQLRRRLSWGLALVAVFFADSVVRSIAHMVQLYKEYWLAIAVFVLLDLYLLAWVLLRRNPGKDKSESWNATDVTEGRTTDGST